MHLNDNEVMDDRTSVKPAHGVAMTVWLFLASVIFSVLGAELALRIFMPEPIHWEYPQEHYVYNEKTGFRLTPNQRSYTHSERVATNSVGVRDREYASYAPPGITRIVAIGDSQTFGNGLSAADTWPKQLLKSLQSREDGRKYQVINAGLSGSDTFQHKELARMMIDAYHPDIVMLGFYVNDVTSPYTLPTSHAQSKTNTLSKRIAYLLKESVLLLTIRQTFETLHYSVIPPPAVIKQDAVVRGLSHPEADKGWDTVESSLDAIKQTAEKQGVDFYIAVLPRRDQVSERNPPFGYNKRIKKIAEGLSIPLVDTTIPLRQSYRRHAGNKQFVIPWDGHNSAWTNHIIGKTISQKFDFKSDS